MTYAGLHKPREVVPMDTNVILILLGLGLAAALGLVVVLLALVAKLGG